MLPLPQKHEAIFKKEEVKKEREIYVIGRPRLDTLTPNERKVFFSTFLQCVIEYFKAKPEEIIITNIEDKE